MKNVGMILSGHDSVTASDQSLLRDFCRALVNYRGLTVPPLNQRPIPPKRLRKPG
jgi:hypothetical protein